MIKTHPDPQILDSRLRKVLPGNMGWILLWLIGISAPFVIAYFLIRCCS